MIYLRTNDVHTDIQTHTTYTKRIDAGFAFPDDEDDFYRLCVRRVCKKKYCQDRDYARMYATCCGCFSFVRKELPITYSRNAGIIRNERFDANAGANAAMRPSQKMNLN